MGFDPKRMILIWVAVRFWRTNWNSRDIQRIESWKEESEISSAP